MYYWTLIYTYFHSEYRIWVLWKKNINCANRISVILECTEIPPPPQISKKLSAEAIVGGKHNRFQRRLYLRHLPPLSFNNFGISMVTCISWFYYPSEVRRGKYWGLVIFLLQYYPLVKTLRLLHSHEPIIPFYTGLSGL